MLVGAGAREYARVHEIPIAEPSTLITENAQKEWRRWKRTLGLQHNEVTPTSAGNFHPKTSAQRLDTVGAVALCADGNIAAGVSRYNLCTLVTASNFDEVAEQVGGCS